MQLYVLGPPRLEREGEMIRLDTRKALALLIYLVKQDHEFQRDTLTSILWPELDQSRARAALRRTLTPLNNALGKDALITTRETVQLNPDYPLWVDERAFDSLLGELKTHGHSRNHVCPQCLTPLQRAAALYLGDFMEGFSLRDSAPFDDWQFSEAERLRRLRAETLEKLAGVYHSQKQFDRALEVARQWLQMDSLHEPAHRALMRLYAEAGQRTRALRQYRECMRVLDRELGVAPLEETTRLYEEILENRLEITAAATPFPQIHTPAQPVSPPEPETRIPLVNRKHDFATLRKEYERAAAGGKIVFIEGEIGIGKTRLAQEALETAQQMGGNVLTARCYEGEINLAYGPIIAALRSALNQQGSPDLAADLAPVWRAEATRLLPELSRPEITAHPTSQTDAAGAQSRLFESIRQIFKMFCSSNAPAVLFIDDLQWADSATIDLLAYLIRRITGLEILLIGAWRSENVPPAHPLRNLHAEALRTGSGQLLHLQRFTPDDIQDLAALFPEASPELKGSLFQRTGGLPFFAIEYLKAGLPGTGEAIPEGVREIQQNRLTHLDEAARQLITTAAVIGRSFDFDTLRAASGRSEEETVIALENLLISGLLVERAGEELRQGPAAPLYDFSHDTIHQIVLEQTSLARLRLLHRRIADSYLSQGHALDENAARIAHHLSRSGQDARAAEFFARAGVHARNLYANAEALAHFQNALALGHPEPAELHEAIGDLRTLRGEYRQAVVSLEKAASLVEPGTLPQIERKIANVHHRRGDYELAESHFEAARDLIQSSNDPAALARLHTDWSWTAYQQNDLARARRLAETGLEQAEASGSAGLVSQAHNILGILTRRSGRLPNARKHLESALEAAGEQLSARIAALNNLALVLSDEENYEEAIPLTEEALAACIKLGDRHREAALRNHLADRLHAHGDRDRAMQQLKIAVEIFAEIGTESGDLQPEIWKLVEW